tara:strand:- start:381 stop:542 length:162 start_codon:yes stop_codon:yes gene_type:complete
MLQKIKINLASFLSQQNIVLFQNLPILHMLLAHLNNVALENVNLWHHFVVQVF